MPVTDLLIGNVIVPKLSFSEFTKLNLAVFVRYNETKLYEILTSILLNLALIEDGYICNIGRYKWLIIESFRLLYCGNSMSSRTLHEKGIILNGFWLKKETSSFHCSIFHRRTFSCVPLDLLAQTTQKKKETGFKVKNVLISRATTSPFLRWT